MITEDQTAVIEFLASPSTHGGLPVDRIDTHSAMVFLAGTRAWKLKRAVRFDYLDFSTAAGRKLMCEAEVRLNRRTAPTVYRGVAAVTRERSGALALGGDGTPIDWVVEMNRFDEAGLFDRLAGRHQLDLDLMGPLARAIAEFHAAGQPRRDHGGVTSMNWVIEGNAAGLAQFGKGTLDLSACFRVAADACRELDRRGVLLDRRRENGRVRQCHGDLHLRNIVLLDGRPTLFDAVEFNDEIACTDTLYDLAFLLMDLWRRELPRHANAVWNVYLGETDELDALSLMPLFLSCRAAIRAKTSATAARVQPNVERAAELWQSAREYLAMAERLLHPPAPSLIAIGGLSGTGKSTLAQGLAPFAGAVPGAVVLRSDEIRKRLCGVPPLQRLGAEGYSAAISDRVYASLAERASLVVQQGHSVIVDAVYTSAAYRQAIERAATNAGVPFVGMWLEASESTLIDRVQRRRADPSDADAAVIELQRQEDTGVLDWQRLDATRSREDLLEQAMASVREQRVLAATSATSLAACR